jgi:hypothetical protein
MKIHYFSLLLVIIMVVLIPGVCSAATVIQPYCYCGSEDSLCSNCDTPGYRWSESTLHIELPGEYIFAEAIFPETEMKIDSLGVTVDGSNANLIKIVGKPDLNLLNIGSGSITECHTILNSKFSSVGTVHGNIENSEISTKEDTFAAVGIGQVYGSIKNSVISLNSRSFAVVGIGQVHGNIENTEILVNSGPFTAAGIGQVYGNIENTEIAVSSGPFTAVGVGQVQGDIKNTDITVSSGHFTVMGVGQVHGNIENTEISVSSGSFTTVGMTEVHGDIESTEVSVSSGSFSAIEISQKYENKSIETKNPDFRKLMIEIISRFVK